MSTKASGPIDLDASWIEQALLLSAEVHWNQLAADWAVFLTHGTVLGVTVAGRLVATAAVLPYGQDFGWISMVLVTQGWRGRGIATRLVAACTAVLRDAGRTAFLDATPAGAAVYAKLGFVPLCGMQRWQGSFCRDTAGGAGMPNAPADLALDQAAFGADRSFLLQDFLSRPGSLAFAGYNSFAVLRQGARAAQLGPIVASAADGGALATAAMNATRGPLLIDVLDAGRALCPMLAASGFHEQRAFTRMALGRAVLPGDPTRLLAAAGPEFG